MSTKLNTQIEGLEVAIEAAYDEQGRRILDRGNCCPFAKDPESEVQPRGSKLFGLKQQLAAAIRAQPLPASVASLEKALDAADAILQKVEVVP